jgi:cytochrome c biogenesis factor
MTYGVVCFSLLFAVFGTIMGGVWANDSWGRFWGWDPKENGALLICLWFLLILHARMGGYVREHGFMVLCILGAVVVSISWWGVNLLSVGLHSYGFTSGALLALVTFWCVEAVFILISVVQRALSGWNGPGAPPATNS